MGFCNKCGHEVDDGANFCKNCGNELSNMEVRYCELCGSEIKNNATFCPNCGLSVSDNSNSVVKTATVNNNYQTNVPVKTKSPILAAILSFFIIGAGQIYLGLVKKGITLFICAIIAGILTLVYIGALIWLIVFVYAIWDAYNSAKRINNGEYVKDSLFS